MATRRPLREPASVSDDRRTTVRASSLTMSKAMPATRWARVARPRSVENDDLSVGGDRSVEIGGSDALRVARDRTTSIGEDDRLSVAGKLLIDAGHG